MPDNRSPSGLAGAVAVLLTLCGVLLWLEMLAGPARLATGLLGASDHLERGGKQLQGGGLKKARREILSAAAAARRAGDAWDGTRSLIDVAAVVPGARELLAQVPHLVAAAEHSTAAARGTLDVAQNGLKGRNRIITKDPEGGARIDIERVEELGSTLAVVREELQAARRELVAVDLDGLPRRARPAVLRGREEAAARDRTLADAEAGFAILPRILGADGPRWYLIGMQNNAELRGPGGALLRFALLKIDRGEPSLEEASVYDLDVDREPISIPLPPDAWYVAGIEDAQRFGNANWSPDWPLSSQLTLAYGRASETKAGRRGLPPVAGVIAVDPFVIKDVLPGVGRYRTEGGRPVTRGNVVPFLLRNVYATHPLRGVRRAVLGDIVGRFYAAFLKPDHPAELVSGLGRSLTHKHMQIWLEQRAEQSYVERMGWDGAIERARRSDYLYVVEQNVGGNKLNYVERQTHTMDVRVAGRDAVTSTEVGVLNGVFLPQPGYWLGDSNGYHRPMINVYVPRRARLLDASVRGDLYPSPEPAIWDGDTPPEHFERGKKVWSATLDIPPQKNGRVRFDYRVPGVVHTVEGRKVYRLVVQHQPKVSPEELTVNLTPPEGAEVVRAQGWRRKSDGRLVWTGAIEEDIVLEVSWR